jgi:hypothetical protein
MTWDDCMKSDALQRMAVRQYRAKIVEGLRELIAENRKRKPKSQRRPEYIRAVEDLIAMLERGEL